MSHLFIARKYRPKNFKEIIGQEQVTVTLRNSIKKQKVSHAYLFSGPRGCGKTTTARVLAKAINCQKYPSPEPCLKCASCEAVENASSIDMIEIDAASNRGIDQIRELIENAAFAPAHARFKVYRIDEAHQITPEAFNAFLKTLEEPPPYAVFILATTAPEKLPVTILSRCQHFKFRLVDAGRIKDTLRDICASEKVRIEEFALDMIASESGGSVRDAESVLEQVIASSQDGKIKKEDIEFILGMVETQKIEASVEAIFKRDIPAAFQILYEVYKKGFSLQQFTKQMIIRLREILTLKISSADTTVTEDISSDHLFWMIESLCAVEQKMKWSDFPKIPLEMCVYKISSEYISIDEVLSGLDTGAEDTTAAVGRLPGAPSGEKQPVKKNVKDEIKNILARDCGALGKLFSLAAEIKVKGKTLSCSFDKNNEPQARRIIINADSIEKALFKAGYPLSVEINISGVSAAPGHEKKQMRKTTAQQLEREEPIISKLSKVVGGGLEGPVDE